MLDIEGAVVTADAMHAQRDAAELTAGKGGDYVLALKGNQGSLHKDAKAWLEDPGNAKKMLSHQQAGRGHGREETRTATVCHDIGPLQDAHRRPGLAAVGKVESVRVSEGRIRTETRHCIMSRKMSPEDFLKAVRNHWAIESRLHWVLDVRMREDDLRNRTGRGPENLVAVRRLVVSIVHQMTTSCRSGGASCGRLRCRTIASSSSPTPRSSPKNFEMRLRWVLACSGSPPSTRGARQTRQRRLRLVHGKFRVQAESHADNFAAPVVEDFRLDTVEIQHRTPHHRPPAAPLFH